MLAVGCAISTTGPLMGEMMREVAEEVTAVQIPGIGHWVPEERPREFLDTVLPFLTGAAPEDPAVPR